MALAPPTCPVTGKHIRWLLLAAVLSYFIYFLVHGLSEPPSSRAVHICDTGNELELIQCNSTEDVTTCANLLDINGNVATCVESSCGYQLFPHIDVSIAGSSDPYDEDAATSTTSFLSVVSVFYSLVPYLLGFVYLVEFLAFGNLVPLSRLVILGVIAITNEVIFKNLVKQNRPEGSCLYFFIVWYAEWPRSFQRWPLDISTAGTICVPSQFTMWAYMSKGRRSKCILFSVRLWMEESFACY